MGALHKLKTAALNEWNTMACKFDFEIERMEARSEQNSDIPERHTFLAQLEYLLTNELRLHLLTSRLDELGPRAGMFPGKKSFFIAFRGALYNLVRDVQNRLRAAVIFFELDDACSREVLRKIHDVAEIGAAEGINALRIITDHGHVLVCSGQQADDLGLQMIRILIFVHHDEAIRIG